MTMSRKIVAIGGGENGRKRSDGTRYPYELANQDKEIIKLICEKYGFSEWEALRKFMKSETYSMLSDSSLEMWDFGYPAIFNMWECEQVTGDPRNSSYFREE